MGKLINDSISLGDESNYIMHKDGNFREYYFGDTYDVWETNSWVPEIKIFRAKADLVLESKLKVTTKSEIKKKQGFRLAENKIEFFSDPLLWETGTVDYRKRAYGFGYTYTITKNKHSNLALGASAVHQRFWDDSSKIRITCFTLGLNFTHHIGQGFYISGGAHPIIQTELKSNERDEGWQNDNVANPGMKALLYLGFNLPVTENLHFGLKYMYIPNHQLLMNFPLKNTGNKNLNFTVSYSFHH